LKDINVEDIVALSHMKKVCEKHFRKKRFKIIKDKGIKGIPWAPELGCVSGNKNYAMKFFPRKDLVLGYNVDDSKEFMKKIKNLTIFFVFPIGEVIKLRPQIIKRILRCKIMLIIVKENTIDIITPHKFGTSISHTTFKIIKDSREYMVQKIITKLKKCKIGPEDWKKFQDLCGEIFEFLFVPPLSTPTRQSRTMDGTKIRDFLFPNNTLHRFWLHTIKQQYKGNIVLLDPKNTKKLRTTEIDKVSNRLKKGLTSFGIIIFRGSKEDNVWRRTIFKYLVTMWDDQKKLIIILNETDLIKSLQDFIDAKDPVGIIESSINEIMSKV